MTSRPTAHAGVLSVGPFTESDTGKQAAYHRGHKVWVASQRAGHDDAVLIVTNPRHEKVTIRRHSGEARVAGAQQFYPGAIPTPVSGMYRLQLTVGADTLCVKVHYHVR